MNMTKQFVKLVSSGIASAAGIALIFAGCGGKTETDPNAAAASGKLKVTTTVNMVSDLVREIAGEHVEVSELMGPGVDPHLFKASAGDVDKLMNADVVFYVGLLLEGKIQSTLNKVESAYAVTSKIDAKRLEKPEEFEGHFDPHIWFDVTLWVDTVDAVVEGLSKADSSHAADYKKNGEATKSKMKSLHEWSLEKVKELPEAKRILITSHDAYNYFGRAYGFKVVGLQGISTVSEASLADVAKMVDFIKENKVKAVFVESSVSPAAIKRISEDSGAVIGGELFSDAMGERGKMEHGYDVGTYEGMIKHNLSTIVDALK
ncbi:MAG: metal ABC transporter solute-binding protein, Zn/Mn family [Limisphaerales bacterium]